MDENNDRSHADPPAAPARPNLRARGHSGFGADSALNLLRRRRLADVAETPADPKDIEGKDGSKDDTSDPQR